MKLLCKFLFPPVLAALILLQICAFGAFAADAGDADKLYGFAEKLFSDGEYFRAISEYKRFLYYYPGDTRLEKASLRIAESYYRVKRWAEAVDSVKEFLAKFPESPLTQEALFLKGMSEYNLKRFDESLSTFSNLMSKGSGEYRDRAIYQTALICVDREEWDRAKGAFRNIPEGSFLFPFASRFAAGLEKIDSLPYKSPAVAGTLAAVLPGSGHLYDERPRDALVAFILNAAFIAAAVELFDHGEYAAGGIVTFFEAGWYSGNIYSAVSSAYKFNKRVKEEYVRNLKDESPPAPPGGRISLKDNQVMYGFSF
ncbi:MAG: outer membrane protein assembly factor BamD [Syntrophobacterales bacterium]|nr:outer membrane protein assembly factor BamD [Syntrophobacterales bacterium]